MKLQLIYFYKNFMDQVNINNFNQYQKIILSID